MNLYIFKLMPVTAGFLDLYTFRGWTSAEPIKRKKPRNLRYKMKVLLVCPAMKTAASS